MNLFINSKNDNRMNSFNFLRLSPSEFSLSTPALDRSKLRISPAEFSLSTPALAHSSYRRRSSVAQLRLRVPPYLLNNTISKEPRKYKTPLTSAFEATPSAIASGVQSLPGAFGYGSLQSRSDSEGERLNSVMSMKEVGYGSLQTDLSIFLQIYSTTKDQMNNNPKIEFRYECYKNLNYIRNLILPIIQKNSQFEAVLIEYRKFPHLEFLIRNTIFKLGDKWSHTVVCGTNNYDYMVEMCNTISSDIKIVKTEYDNLTPSMYSKMFSSEYFWDFFIGEKILIYQEDSIIFKNNIEEFLHFDYIGAPWPEGQNDNMNGVGNGGISLRSRSIMKKIIQTICIEDTEFNSSTLEYITNAYINDPNPVPPEDVYFSKNIEDLNIGVLADRESAYQFSTESILNKNSFAGHNFWINDPSWKQRIYDSIVIQFIDTHNTDAGFNQHRGGWKSVIQNLTNQNFYSNNSNIYFFDMLENQFLFNTNYTCDKKWAGIIHCTPLTPSYLDNININNLFKNVNFINALKDCICIFTLSRYISCYLEKMFNEKNISVKIFTIKHPVDMENILLFDMGTYITNQDKKIIQVGQQLRKVTSIYCMPIINGFKKLWLTGNSNLKRCKYSLDSEYEYFKLNKNNIDNHVKMHYTYSYNEYDVLLSENIVFAHLFDAAANNTVLECIIRNTPIIINKIQGVVDYLGEDYPLYFTDVNEVPNILLNFEKINQAHEYLLKMNKQDITITYFTNQLITILNKNINEKMI